MPETEPTNLPMKVGVNVLFSEDSPDVGMIEIGFWHCETGQDIEVEDGSMWTVIENDGIKIYVERKTWPPCSECGKAENPKVCGKSGTKSVNLELSPTAVRDNLDTGLKTPVRLRDGACSDCGRQPGTTHSAPCSPSRQWTVVS